MVGAAAIPKEAKADREKYRREDRADPPSLVRRNEENTVQSISRMGLGISPRHGIDAE